MNFKIISVFLYLSVVLSIVVQNNAFVPPQRNGNNFRRRAADISGCKKVIIFFNANTFCYFSSILVIAKHGRISNGSFASFLRLNAIHLTKQVHRKLKVPTNRS